MTKRLQKLLLEDTKAQAVGMIFVGLLVWWIYILMLGDQEGAQRMHLLWAASYQILALLGGIWGIRVAAGWGGARSVMGRSIIAFSTGLLLQVFGQSVFSAYNLFLEVEVPYPSIADIGFFGSIPFYIYGILLLAKASGVTISLQSYSKKMQTFIIPLIMLGGSYYFFLRGYEVPEVEVFPDSALYPWDYYFSLVIRPLLDYGYPLGQAIYVAIAILTYTLSKKVLGGIMRGRVLFILIALIVQYVADSNFLYQAINLTWYNGGYGDLLYMLSYMVMAIGLLQLQSKYIHAENL